MANPFLPSPGPLVQLTNGLYAQAVTLVDSAGNAEGAASGITAVETTPTILTATSTTLLAADAARRYCLIQNNSSANIMISLSGNVLTGIVNTATNIGLVMVPGGSYESQKDNPPVGAITVYQTSGGTINTVYVAKG